MMKVFMPVIAVQGAGLPIFADYPKGVSAPAGTFFAGKAYTRPPDDLGDETMTD